MRPYRVVVISPSLDQHLRLLQRIEDFRVQEFVPELAVEALVVAVLPWASGFDVEHLHTDPSEPGPDSRGRELGAVIGPDMIRRAVFGKQRRQAIQDVVALELPAHVDRQAPAGVFVDDRQHPECLAVVRPVHDEVVAPDMVRPARPEPDAGPVVQL